MSWTPTILIKVDEKLERAIEKKRDDMEKWINEKQAYNNLSEEILKKEIEELEKANEKLDNPIPSSDLRKLAMNRTTDKRDKIWREFNKKREKMKGWLLDSLIKISEDIENGRFLKIENKNYICIETEWTCEAEDLVDFLEKNKIVYVIIGG